MQIVDCDNCIDSNKNNCMVMHEEPVGASHLVGSDLGGGSYAYAVVFNG